MSKVMDAPAQPGQTQPQSPETPQQDWILDDTRPPQRWAMDDTPMERVDRQAGQAPAATPPGQVQQTPGGQPGQGYQYTLPNGTILRGNTPEDVIKQFETALIQLANQQANQQPREFARREQPQAQPAPIQRTPFDSKRFYALLADEKPIEAMHMLNQEYYGVDDPREIGRQATSTYTDMQEIRERMSMADFLSKHPEFPYGPQAGQLMADRLNREGVDATAWNLELAYQQLVSEGAIRPVVAQPPQQPAQPQFQQPQAPPTQQPQSRGAGAPPLPGNQGGEIGDRELSVTEFEQLSTAEMKKYLEKRGLV